LREKQAVEKVIDRMCRHVERCKGRAPEGKELRVIVKRVREGAMKADRRRSGSVREG